MTTSHPLAVLWQPRYLHELDQLTQGVADVAIAAVRPEIDPALAGTRFIHAYRKLHKQLEPFRQHDPDRPTSWPPEADRGLLFALLGFLSTLENLQPPAQIAPWKYKRKKVTCYDGAEAVSNLKELRPTVSRLEKTADEIHQLIARRLLGSEPSQSATSESNFEIFVTLDQAAAIVQRSKRTLERHKGRMPSPRVEGGGGKCDEWAWSELRPWLEQEYGRKLPERFPSDRIP